MMHLRTSAGAALAATLLLAGCGAEPQTNSPSEGANVSPSDRAELSPADRAILSQMGVDPSSMTSITEFIVVTFPEERRVLVDGNPMGSTGELIFIDSGVHVITLEGEASTPPEIVHRFEGTTVSAPFTAAFERAP
jgi:hypothetical protein